MPGQPQYSLQPATKTSAAAITSLICGILGFCTVGVSSIVAVITGIVGLVATKNPTVKGRGMAIAGLVLGILTLVGWGIFGISVASMLHITPAQSSLANQFVSDLSAGNLDAAQAECTANVSATTLLNDSTLLKTWGSGTSVKLIGVHVPNTPAGTTTVIDAMSYPGGSHNITLQIVDDSSGNPKIDGLVLQ
jgi:hypothetical protein